MAFSRIVGFDVTPVTESSAMYLARVPSAIRPLRMLSSQMLWPVSCSCFGAPMSRPSPTVLSKHSIPAPGAGTAVADRG